MSLCNNTRSDFGGEISWCYSAWEAPAVAACKNVKTQLGLKGSCSFLTLKGRDYHMSRFSMLRRSWRPASLWATRGAPCPALRIMCTHVGAGSGGRSGGVVIRSPPEDLPYTVKGLKHISIAVPDLASAAEHYRCAFGAHVSAPMDQLDEGVKVVHVKLPNVAIELLHPLRANSAVAKFLEKNPSGGIHHLCFAVDDLNSASRYLEDLGVERINDDGNLHQQSVLNLNPKDTMGVHVQLQQAN